MSFGLGFPNTSPISPRCNTKRLYRGVEERGLCRWENIQIDFQNAQGEQRNLKNISKQLVEESDLVFAIATPSAQSLTNTTKTTPVVFSAVTDPLAAEIGEELEEPGGNITGTSDQSEDAISTQVDMIKQVLPTTENSWDPLYTK